MVMNTSLNFLMIYMTGNEYYGALHLRFYFIDSFLQILRGSAATNIAVLCAFVSFYKFISTNTCLHDRQVTRLCRYKYCGALHLRFQFLNTFLQILRGSAATNIAVLCRYKYCCSLRLCFIL